jgi:nickel-dependent lactate racemase
LQITCKPVKTIKIIIRRKFKNESLACFNIFICGSGVHARRCEEETAAELNQDRAKRAHREECWGSSPSETTPIHEDDEK